jgi:hypothetical protein
MPVRQAEDKIAKTEVFLKEASDFLMQDRGVLV